MSRKQDTSCDRNFDALAKRFTRNIYGSLKGQIRLQVLRRDLLESVPQLAKGKSLNILDAGAGQGQFAIELAQLGHTLILNDISSEMLKLAAQYIAQQQDDDLENRIKFIQQPLQNLAGYLAEGEHRQSFDIILCHAVIEWLAKPEELLPALVPLLKPGGYFSLLFYNVHGLEFKNLLRTNFTKFNPDNFKAYKGSLTPINPLQPDQVRIWLKQNNLQIVCESGIRVFHDYIFERKDRDSRPDELLAKELEYSRKDPFRQIARYMHLLCKKSN